MIFFSQEICRGVLVNVIEEMGEVEYSRNASKASACASVIGGILGDRGSP